jgi:hypothetical protein
VKFSPANFAWLVLQAVIPLSSHDRVAFHRTRHLVRLLLTLRRSQESAQLGQLTSIIPQKLSNSTFLQFSHQSLPKRLPLTGQYRNDMSGRNCATYPAHSTLLAEGAHNHGESSAPSAAEGWEVGREIKPRSSKRSNAALSGAIVTKTSVLACALLRTGYAGNLRTRVCRKVVDQHHPNLHLMSHDEG